MDIELPRRRRSRFAASILIITTVLFGAFVASVQREPVDGIGYVGIIGAEGESSTLDTKSSRNESDSSPSGRISGSLVDEDGLPVSELQVELIPSGKTGDSEWSGRQSAWSDRFGEYVFKSVPPGEYFVGVHIEEAPDGRLPYETAYYPGERARADAQKVHVADGDRVALQWMRLHRIETVTIPVSLRWRDDQIVERGNLLFNNLSYPHSAPVGGFAPQIDNGEGVFILPEGFEYIARGKVDCDSGSQIQTIESRPIQQFIVSRDEHPEKLTFVIPSPSCTLWKPTP